MTRFIFQTICLYLGLIPTTVSEERRVREERVSESFCLGTISFHPSGRWKRDVFLIILIETQLTPLSFILIRKPTVIRSVHPSFRPFCKFSTLPLVHFATKFIPSTSSSSSPPLSSSTSSSRGSSLSFVVANFFPNRPEFV